MPVRNVTFHHANRKDTVNMGKYPFKDVEALVARGFSCNQAEGILDLLPYPDIAKDDDLASLRMKANCWEEISALIPSTGRGEDLRANGASFFDVVKANLEELMRTRKNLIHDNAELRDRLNRVEAAFDA